MNDLKSLLPQDLVEDPADPLGQSLLPLLHA